MGVCALLRGMPLRSELSFSFARHTTIGCGGEAAAAVCPGDLSQLSALLRLFEREGVSYLFLGAGANVLPPDGRFEGFAVRFCAMDRLHLQGGKLFAGAGVTGGALCRFAREHGIGGFEPLTGIPMSVGGAVVMNAGVAEGHISDRILRVVAVKGGEIAIFRPEECRFSEKDSIFRREKIAVAGVLFEARPAPKEEIASRTAYFRSRRSALPHGRSMGCTFVNPKGNSAGAIIDACGLKGTRIGGAYVSEKHANFIINEGSRSADVLALATYIREEVHRRTGILLREEFCRLP